MTLNQVITTTGNAQVVSPLTFLEASTPGTGGFIETPQQRLQVRHLLEKIADPGELARVPVEGTDGRLQLGDVADVKVDHQPLIGDAVVAGGPGLFLVVEKFPGVSTREVTEGVEDALEALRPGLTGITSDTTVFRPADYVSEALDNLGLAALIGGAPDALDPRRPPLLLASDAGRAGHGSAVADHGGARAPPARSGPERAGLRRPGRRHRHRGGRSGGTERSGGPRPSARQPAGG